MSPHSLHRRQIVHSDMDSVFGFFKDPRNLEVITPPWLRFSVRHTTTESVEVGTEIQYRLRWQIFPMSWRSRIAEYVEGVRFADEMTQGPYKHWYHRHLFRSVPEGVEVVDVVEYELPFGLLGRLTHAAAVRSQLEAIFDYRRVATERHFAADSRLGVTS